MEVKYLTLISKFVIKINKMTQSEFQQSGYQNRHSKFIFKSGEIVYGVLHAFFYNEPNNYYLVRSNQLMEFKKFMDSNDFINMKKLCSLMNFDDLEKVELLDSFGELLVKKTQEVEKNKVDWEARKSTWLVSIENFYLSINNWLDDFKNADLLKIKEKEIDLNEEYIGNYKTKRLEIYLGNDIITFTPRGTLIIGSYGRIDMRGPKGEALIVEPNWNDWKFAKRTPRMKYVDVTEQSIKEVIQDIING
jgi:hypothetical protein